MIQFRKTGKVTDFRGWMAKVGHTYITLLREVTPFLSMYRVDKRAKLLCWSREGLDLRPPRVVRRKAID